MRKNTGKRLSNPNVERDDLNTAEEKQNRENRKSKDIEERPVDRARGREEGNKSGPPTPTPDPAGGNL